MRNLLKNQVFAAFVSMICIIPATFATNDGCIYTPQESSGKTLFQNSSKMPHKADKKIPVMDTSERRNLRRLWIDVVGLHPDQQQVNAFIANTQPDKWAQQVEVLLASDAFTERWTTFFDDLLWNHILVDAAILRNNMHNRLRTWVSQNTPVDEMVRQIITADGRNEVPGSANFFYIKRLFDEQYRLDYLDDQLGVITETFLGMQTNCISCHDGAYHLEEVNAGLATMTRAQFWAMAAFLAKSDAFIETDYLNNFNFETFIKKMTLVDLDKPGFSGRYGYFPFSNDEPRRYRGEYYAVSESGMGMRPRRNGGLVSPAYFTTGETPREGETRRMALARMITSDRQFARNIVNRVWAHFLGKGFVEPLGSWDLGRLNEAVAAEHQTTVQATTPKLMEWLTDAFIASGYDLKALIRLIATGPIFSDNPVDSVNAWPEVSKWKRNREPRRLDAETLVAAFFQIHRLPMRMVARGYIEKAATNPWEMPGPYEPFLFALYRNPDAPTPEALGFSSDEEYRVYQTFIYQMLQSFDRGQYDLAIARAKTPSIQNTLTLMNNEAWNFWLNEGQSTPFLQDLIARVQSQQTPLENLVKDMYHTVLFREPTARELALSETSFVGKDPEIAVKNLLWSLFNHPDFFYR